MSAGGDGFCAAGEGGGQPPRPDLRRVRAEGLADPGRTLELHRQAVDRGLVAAGESGRLRVLAAAEHARSAGRSNPPGLFASVLRRGLWGYITGAEEDAAAHRLKAHLHGPPPPRVPAPPGPAGPPAGQALSADAALVRLVRSRAGPRVDAYHVLRRDSSAWTRERYDRAASELSTPRGVRSPDSGVGGDLLGLSTPGSALGGLGQPWACPPWPRAAVESGEPRHSAGDPAGPDGMVMAAPRPTHNPSVDRPAGGDVLAARGVDLWRSVVG